MTEQWTMPARRRVTQKEIDRAVQADAEIARTEFRAVAVSYDESADRVNFSLPGGEVLAVPRASIDGLSELSPADMHGLRLWPDGVLLEIPERDVHLHVPRLLARAIEVITPPAVLTSIFGRVGGSVTSEKKRLASIANGKRGGRKPKPQTALG
ncbi:hypothetical protein [Rhodopila globiformis]|uniref:DUF2442 domain-containing protein n=1 Tax=Rhodopila globiformis TaxID=1071 RepID=A0A2S6MXD7_RHOGL|nr:hypothetical protein [Rhodopila globiformis]PPQ27020.1 hypothetical protein CCS01_28185 [Rhodopila globiformis]